MAGHSKPHVGIGTKLYLHAADDTAFVPADVVGSIQVIDGINLTRDSAEWREYNSGWVKKVAATKMAEDIEITMTADGNANVAALEALWESGDYQYFAITQEEGADDGVSWRWQGFVKAFSHTLEQDDVNKINITIAVNGEMVRADFA